MYSLLILKNFHRFDPLSESLTFSHVKLQRKKNRHHFSVNKVSLTYSYIITVPEANPINHNLFQKQPINQNPFSKSIFSTNITHSTMPTVITLLYSTTVPFVLKFHRKGRPRKVAIYYFSGG